LLAAQAQVLEAAGDLVGLSGAWVAPEKIETPQVWERLRPSNYYFQTCVCARVCVEGGVGGGGGWEGGGKCVFVIEFVCVFFLAYVYALVPLPCYS
jgi:hypothetical protein